MVVLAIAAGSLALGHKDDVQPASDVRPGRVEHIAGSNISRVVLTAEAAKRLDIATQPVRDEPAAGSLRKVISYAAVLYEASGATYTFTNPEPLVFVRAPITVDSIQGDRAILSAGPAAGTPVVTVGATELYGTEFGVSGDE
jgi:hypothetical protein